MKYITTKFLTNQIIKTVFLDIIDLSNFFTKLNDWKEINLCQNKGKIGHGFHTISTNKSK